MKRCIVMAVLSVLLIPAQAMAVARPRDPRLNPWDISPWPSFVQRVEPAIIAIRTRARDDAPSSANLGTKRFASGVIFDARGYALTVAYTLIDATSVDAQLLDDRTVPARVVGLDLQSGLGVIKLDGDGPWPTARLGDSRDVVPGSLSGTVGVDEDNELVAVSGTVRAIRRFAASWEYMLERAFIVAPASPAWSGSAVVDERGFVIAVASLRLGEAPHVDLAIPIETFVPVKDEIIAVGRVMTRRARPWLGVYTAATDGGLRVERVADAGPARRAGLLPGDRIAAVDGVDVRTQEQFYEVLWRATAGDVIRLSIVRDGQARIVDVTSIDRHSLFRAVGR